MAWATVRNEGESYLYSYLRSGTGTTGEPTGTTDPKGFDRYNQPIGDFYEKIAYRYYRSTTGTTGSTDFGEDKFCGKKTYRYYRAFTGTTGPRPVLPVHHRYYR
jgi:hypothetical protein